MSTADRCLWSLALTTFAASLVPAVARAQADPQTTSVSSSADSNRIWALGGFDATIARRWLVVTRLGHLGGFDSRLLLAEVMFQPRDSWRVFAGEIYLDPVESRARGTSVVRAGVAWSPLQRRVGLENRVLVERLSGGARPIAGRVRNRVTASFATTRLRMFGSIELFASGAGLDAQRYQAGGSRGIGPTALEVYWVQQRSRQRPTFNALGLTYIVSIPP